jgi:para-nitrobenzyl esterase
MSPARSSMALRAAGIGAILVFLAACGGGSSAGGQDGGPPPAPINTPPIASFSATPSSGLAPLTVELNAAASRDPDGQISSYSWSFGDGTAGGSGVATTHDFAAPGQYTVVLTVTDNLGASNSTSKIVDVRTPTNSSVPTVRRNATYPVLYSTHVYGQGLQHTEWGGGTTTPTDLLLDLYVPQGAPAGRPALVIIHGGAFRDGSRTQAQLVSFAEYFTSRGWVSISIDYRLLGDRGTLPPEWLQYVQNQIPPADRDQAAALYPAARDAKAAVRWLYANAATYQVNTDYVTAMGGSAGAYLAIVLGVTDPEDFRDEVPASADPTLATTHLDQPSRVRTVIDHWGGLAHLRILEAIDGRSRFDMSDAPVSIVHGTADPTVPFTEAEALRDAYFSTGVPFAFYPLQGRGHGPWDATFDGMTLEELAMAFVIEQQALNVVE